MPVHAVVTRVQLSADKPLPERGVAGIQRRVPILIPGEQISILLEAFGEILLAKALENIRISGIGLSNKLRRRVVVIFFLPVNCDLSLGDLKLFILFPSHNSRLPPLPKMEESHRISVPIPLPLHLDIIKDDESVKSLSLFTCRSKQLKK